MSETFHNQPSGADITPFGLLQKLRRQFTSAGDWKSAIANSELSQEAQAAITTLVKQTKLMRYEKFEIADELISHFVDGLERGTTSDELISAFGDPEVAATLFRSSKLRRRPMAIRAGQMILWTVLALGTVYMALMVFFHAASPEPNVDYSVQMNQNAAAVPEDQRAWPVYRDAWTKYDIGQHSGQFIEIYSEYDKARCKGELIRPEDEGWDLAVEKLKASSDLLEAFRIGSKLDHLGLELQVNISDYSEADFVALFPNKDYATEVQKAADGGNDSSGIVGLSEEADRLLNASLTYVLLPHTNKFLVVSGIFQVDTRLAVIENDPDRVVDNIEAILGFARQQNNESLIVCHRFGTFLFKMAVAQVEEVLRESPGFLEETHLARLQNAIGDFDFTKLDFSDEPMQKDILQRVYSDDGNGDGHLTPEGLELLLVMKSMNPRHNKQGFLGLPDSLPTRRIFGPALILSSPGRKEMAEKMDALNKEAKARYGTPWWEDDLSNFNELWNEVLGTIYVTDWFQTCNGYLQIAIAHQDAGLLGIAIERYRLKFDAWPQSLDDLEGEFLSATPLDRVTGEPLKFKASDESVTIYSVGGDLDDDGGQHDAQTIPMIAADYDQSADGDWVLWPVDRD